MTTRQTCLQSFTHPEATEAVKCRVERAAVAAEQLLNGVLLLGGELHQRFKLLLPLDADPPLQYLHLRHDHYKYTKNTCVSCMLPWKH